MKNTNLIKILHGLCGSGVCVDQVCVCIRCVCVCVTHHPGLVLVADLQVAHGLDDGHDGLDGVAVDHRSVLLAFVF